PVISVVSVDTCAAPAFGRNHKRIVYQPCRNTDSIDSDASLRACRDVDIPPLRRLWRDPRRPVPCPQRASGEPPFVEPAFILSHSQPGLRRAGEFVQAGAVRPLATADVIVDVIRTSHGLFPDPDAASPCLTRFSRPSARARLSVLDRDVGALLLLRDALAARPLHGEIPAAGRACRQRDRTCGAAQRP